MHKSTGLNWIDAWNNHDLERILEFYDEKISHTSPKIDNYFLLPDHTIKSKDMLRQYFQNALAQNPDLRFDLIHMLEGIKTLVLVYKRNEMETAAEFLGFNDSGLIISSRSHYEVL